jgi:hypothetical protein
VNEQGHVSTLVASQPGNRNAERTGLFARMERPLEPTVQAMAAEVMALPHTGALDEVGAVEIAKLVHLLDRIDADLNSKGLTRKKRRASCAAGLPRPLLPAPGRMARPLRAEPEGARRLGACAG